MLGFVGSGIDEIVKNIFEEKYYPHIEENVKNEFEKMFKNNEFEKIVWSIIRKYKSQKNLGEFTQDDLASELAIKIMQDLPSIFLKYVKSEDLNKEEILKIFQNFIYRRLIELVRKDVAIHQKQKPMEINDDSLLSLVKNPRTNEPLEKDDLEIIKRDLFKSIEKIDKDGKNGIMYKLLEAWWNEASKTGLSKEISPIDIYRNPIIQETGLSRPRIEQAYRNLKKKIVKYFERKRNIIFPKEFKNKLHVASDGNMFRKLFASYMVSATEFKTPEEFAIEVANNFNNGNFELKLSFELKKIANLLK